MGFKMRTELRRFAAKKLDIRERFFSMVSKSNSNAGVGRVSLPPPASSKMEVGDDLPIGGARAPSCCSVG